MISAPAARENVMHKDDAMAIAFEAKNMQLDDLVAKYVVFVQLCENTPWHMPDKPMAFNRLLHASMGVSTEAAELLDALKKEMFGKNKQLSMMNIKEELGDLLFYITLAMQVCDLTFQDLIADNVVKLANRYIERFEV